MGSNVPCQMCSTHRRNFPQWTDARGTYHASRWTYGRTCILPITESIAKHGITFGRMKTGTPVRIDGRSVHYEDMEIQDGECDFHKFSFMDTHVRHLKQLPCWTCFTNEEAHRILQEGLPDSPLFNGQIQSIGPRYCPSIETKIVTFPDKPQHQLFLEPEGETTQELYLNGFSSSLPMNIQIAALKRYRRSETSSSTARAMPSNTTSLTPPN